MHKIFTKIEKNNYAAKGTANHGFDGFFQTTMGSKTQSNQQGPLSGNSVMTTYAKDCKTIAVSGAVVLPKHPK
jgi:choline dehydrogenase